MKVKQMIEEKSYDISDDINGFSFEKIEDFLNSIILGAPDGSCNFRICKEYYGYDGGFDLLILYDRPETDKEYELRIKKEEKEKQDIKLKKAIKKEKELKELERLKKKYENES